MDLCLWTMSTALDGKDGCGEGAPITLTTMDALTMMMLEFNVHQVTLYSRTSEIGTLWGNHFLSLISEVCLILVTPCINNHWEMLF